MGTIKQGITGGFSGKVGTVIGASWRTQNTMRSVPKKSKLPPTEKQLVQRARMALISPFLVRIKPLLSAYFGQASGDKSKMNLATSWHMLEAIEGEYPGFSINFQKVIISKGELTGTSQSAATPLGNHTMQFSWRDNSAHGLAKPNDCLLAVIYNEDKKCFRYEEDSATRSEAVYMMALPADWVGDRLHSWMAFVSANKKVWSNSMYLGDSIL